MKNGRKNGHSNGKVRVAIVGVGNCASSFVQGVQYYRNASRTDFVPGLMHVDLGGYHVSDIEFVAAFDIDKKKVGLDLSKAIFAGPNNTVKFSDVLMFENFPLVAAPSSSLTLSADLMWDIADDRLDQLQLLDVRYEVRPSSLAAPDFLQRVLATSRYAVYRVPLSTTEAFAAETTYFSVPTQAALFALNRPWFNGPAPARRGFYAYEYPAARAATLFTRAGCNDGAVSVDRAVADRIEAAVSCSAATTLVLKVNYHPGWHVTIDGKETPTYMASPSFLAADLPAGRHDVVARYESNPVKVPLAIAGLAIAALLFWRRRQIEDWATSFLLMHFTT